MQMDDGIRVGKFARKKYVLTFGKAVVPIVGFRTKFGGQPNLVESISWPLDPKSGEKLMFFAQIRTDRVVFPDGSEKMLFIFLGDSSDIYSDLPSSQVVVQPLPSDSSVPVSIEPGPTIRDWDQKPGEFEVTYKLSEDRPGSSDEEYWDAIGTPQIAGLPYFASPDDVKFFFGSMEEIGSWDLLLMLSVNDDTPFLLPGFGPMYWLFVDGGFSRHKLCIANLC
jgi:Domain of unknown function (DUF1963)